MNLAERNSTLRAPTGLFFGLFFVKTTVNFAEISFTLLRRAFFRCFSLYIYKSEHLTVQFLANSGQKSIYPPQNRPRKRDRIYSKISRNSPGPPKEDSLYRVIFGAWRAKNAA